MRALKIIDSTEIAIKNIIKGRRHLSDPTTTSNFYSNLTFSRHI